MDTAIIFALVPIFLLLLLSAFFSGSETAVTAASRPRMHQLEQQGIHSAGIVNRLRERNEKLIGAILLGNNLVNILASAIATSFFIGWFGSNGVAYATLVMTLLVLIFAEVLPKTYAITRADQLALAVAPVLRVIVYLFSPITQAIHFVARGTLILFGIKFAHGLHGHSEEELRGAIELHEGQEPEIVHERKMLRSILDLADVEVDEIMVHRSAMAMVDIDQKASEIIEHVLSSPFTRIPLYKGESENIIGVLHVKALLRAVHAKTKPLTKENVVALATEPWFVPESTSLLDQLHAFRERHEHFALVVDEYGALLGVVTLEDILEEIVGDIADETDVPVRGVRPQPDGSFMVDGSVTLRDLNREFDWSLPDEEAVTVAGLIMHEARQIPEVGQVYTYYGFRFEILRRHKNRITVLRMTPIESEEPVPVEE